MACSLVSHSMNILGTGLSRATEEDFCERKPGVLYPLNDELSFSAISQ